MSSGSRTEGPATRAVETGDGRVVEVNDDVLTHMKALSGCAFATTGARDRRRIECARVRSEAFVRIAAYVADVALVGAEDAQGLDRADMTDDEFHETLGAAIYLECDVACERMFAQLEAIVRARFDDPVALRSALCLPDDLDAGEKAELAASCARAVGGHHAD